MDERIKLIYCDRFLVGDTEENVLKYIIFMIRLINKNNDIAKNTYAFLKQYTKDESFLNRFVSKGVSYYE